MKSPARLRTVVDGRLWFSKGSHPFLGKGRVDLLEAIAKYGSIAQAAKAMQMSYKAAWDLVDAMNNLSETLLVERVKGGKSGGGAKLTAKGLRVVEIYKTVQREHENFMRSLSRGIEDFNHFYQLLRRLSMKTSARNHFVGKVTAIKPGSVNAEVELTISGGNRIVAIITKESLEDLDLKEGTEAYALIKAPWVIITPESRDMKFSARNKLCGTVTKLTKGAVNADVTLELEGGNSVSSIITNESVEELGLVEGSRACAIFKASSVILGVTT